MEKPTQTIEKRLAEQDINLLYQIYKYRALSTAQLATLGKLGRWFVYKKISQLRKEGYIHSYHIKGNYILDQSRQGSYHRLSGKALSLLKEMDELITSTADELKVSDKRLVYLLTANDLIIPLIHNGWEFENSRMIKQVHDMNRGDIIQGTLINPNDEKEYALYIFMRTIQEQTMIRIKKEIDRSPFQNILVVTRGKQSFETIIHSFASHGDKLIKGGGIKVMPLRFAENYLTISDDNKKNHRTYLESLGLTIVGDPSFKNDFEKNLKFEYLVRHNGEEKYFVDLLDNDLMKLEEIIQYRKEEYERDGRKVLVLTSETDFHIFHRQALNEIHHVEYMTVNPKHPIAFARNQKFKNDSGEGEEEGEL